MFTLLLMLQAATADIVIKGKRLVEAQADCARGNCTPLRDATATIALAESQFRDGEYLKAKRLLAAAVARNKDKAGSDPRPVAALYEAYATVAIHEGDRDTYRSAVADQVRVLRDHLPADDNAVVLSSITLGDMWMKLRDYRRAQNAYRAAEAEARRRGEDRAAVLAGLRLAALDMGVGKKAVALRRISALEALPVAADPEVRKLLTVMRVRAEAVYTDRAKTGDIADQVGGAPGDRQLLVWEPPYDLVASSDANSLSRAQGFIDPIPRTASEQDAVQWADIGFWVKADGRTAEAEVLQASAGNRWAEAILPQVEGRRYSPIPAASVPEEGSYRIERFTRRSDYTTPIGSLVRRRMATNGFEIVDLTNPDAKPRPAS
jgi:tetratricopeptide (TPR) repeat protein